jgi:cytochrome c553
MKQLQSILAGLALSVAASGPLLADDLRVNDCTWCHGTTGQGYSKAPRIAGQSAAYIAKQLQGFASHKREETLNINYMWNAAAHLDAETERGLAAYFAALPPEAARDGDQNLVAAGKAIFENGVPDANVAACQACHGPEAQGVREIPRLGGLSSYYVTRRLNEFGASHSAWGAPMPKVARSLSPDQVAALASFLSFVDVETTVSK